MNHGLSHHVKEPLHAPALTTLHVFLHNLKRLVQT